MSALALPVCCELDEPYQAPPGYYDQPFIYVLDADELTTGANYKNLSIITYSGADFILRRVAGHDRCATGAQFYDVLRRQIFLRNFKTAGFGEFALAPELLFPSASGIQFDFLDAQPAVNACESGIAQVIFQGVRRYKGYRRPPSYPYIDDDYWYTFDVAIDSNFPAGDTQQFGIDILDNDFELLEIRETIINPSGGGAAVACGGANQMFKIQLYDQVYEKVFSKPVVDDLICSNATTYQSISPVPGIVYRIAQQIRFDLTSLCDMGVCPYQVQLCFHGVRRRPC